MTKDTILNSAVKVFAHKGFDQASVDDIAATAKVAKGTLYYHFTSKTEILQALVERGIGTFTKLLKKETSAETDPKKKLEIAIEVQLNFFTKHNDFSRILLSEIWRYKNRWQKYIDLIRENYLTIISEIVTDGIESGQFKKDLDIEAAEVAIFSLISFASLDWAVFHNKKSKEDMLKTLKIIFFEGLSK